VATNSQTLLNPPQNLKSGSLGRTTDEQSPSRMIKEEDLDYNSENNHSSLSSIHKEIYDIQNGSKFQIHMQQL